jgi:hypothetical protein
VTSAARGVRIEASRLPLQERTPTAKLYVVSSHPPIDPTLARRVAAEWFEAWNGHDLEAVLSHYADDVEFTSPFAVELTGRADGTLYGIDELRTYFARALAAFPELRFTDLRVAQGVSSITLCYRSVRGLEAAETMFLGPDGKIVRVLAHYYEPAPGG